MRTKDGRVTRFGAVVRSENLGRLTPAGWVALSAYGIRTIIDLRSPDPQQSRSKSPDSTTSICVPVEEGLRSDPEYVEWERDRTLSTPLYFRRFLIRWPDRIALVLRAVARARPGGTLIHCEKGRDRTGLIVLVLLVIAGVSHDEIVADYGLTSQRVARPLASRLGAENTNHFIAKVLERNGITVEASLLDTISWLEVHLDEFLAAAGVSDAERESIAARLVEPTPT